MDKARATEVLEYYLVNTDDTTDLYNALKFAITALDNLGCGCGICLTHNNFQCPKMKG